MLVGHAITVFSPQLQDESSVLSRQAYQALRLQVKNMDHRRSLGLRGVHFRCRFVGAVRVKGRAILGESSRSVVLLLHWRRARSSRRSPQDSAGTRFFYYTGKHVEHARCKYILEHNAQRLIGGKLHLQSSACAERIQGLSYYSCVMGD